MVNKKRKEYKPILCMDFDGVIHSYTSGWKDVRTIPDPPVLGALDFLSTAIDHFDVAIYSSRSNLWLGRRAMRQWLHDQTVVYINKTVDDNSGWAKIDREVEFPVLRWLELDTMEPWNLVVRDAADRFVKALSWPKHKPPAMVSIDDRALTFTGQWPAISSLQQFKPWNKK